MDHLAALLDDHSPYAIEDRSTDGERQSGRDTIRVYFSSPFQSYAAEAAIRRIAHPAIALERVEVVDDGQLWVERSQACLRAVRVGRVIIAPPWDLPKGASPDTVVVAIRPSMGFGTGHHASTRLCLRALQERPVAGEMVIDLGTGSGVLAIAAATLGATPVLAIDSDRDAVQCAQENVTANGVSSTVRILAADIGHAGFSHTADVVLANLTGELLVRSAGTILSYGRMGSRLIVSGFTVAEFDRVEEAFIPHAREHRRLCEDEWACLTIDVTE